VALQEIWAWYQGWKGIMPEEASLEDVFTLAMQLLMLHLT